MKNNKSTSRNKLSPCKKYECHCRLCSFAGMRDELTLFFCFFSPFGLTKETVYDILIIDREELQPVIY
nr:MAG TPA: hypothetical protein [Caudoviricetes sp.]